MVNSEFFDRVLMPLKGKPSNKKNIFSFDVETHHIDFEYTYKNGNTVTMKKQLFLCGSIVGKDFCMYTKDKNKFISVLLSSKTRNSIIAATNLQFDFMCLFGDNLSNFKLIYRHGLLAAIYKKDRGDGKFNMWKFVDTGNYSKSSVAKLGNMVGIPKLEKPSFLGHIPKDNNEWEIIRRYNINDSLITYKFMDQFKYFCDNINMKLQLTISSCALDYWRRNHQSKAFFREPEWMLKKHFEGALRGGLTLALKRGSYDGKIYCSDIKSCYPSVMFEGIDGKGSYPDPNTSQYVRKGTLDLVEKYEGICKVKVKAPYMYFPYLGFKKD